MANIQLGRRPLSSGRTIFFPPDWIGLLESLTPADIRLAVDEWLKHPTLSQDCTLSRSSPNPQAYLKLYCDQIYRIKHANLTISEAVRQAIAWKYGA